MERSANRRALARNCLRKSFPVARESRRQKGLWKRVFQKFANHLHHLARWYQRHHQLRAGGTTKTISKICLLASPSAQRVFTLSAHTSFGAIETDANCVCVCFVVLLLFSSLRHPTIHTVSSRKARRVMMARTLFIARVLPSSVSPYPRPVLFSLLTGRQQRSSLATESGLKGWE